MAMSYAFVDVTYVTVAGGFYAKIFKSSLDVAKPLWLDHVSSASPTCNKTRSFIRVDKASLPDVEIILNHSVVAPSLKPQHRISCQKRHLRHGTRKLHFTSALVTPQKQRQHHDNLAES